MARNPKSGKRFGFQENLESETSVEENVTKTAATSPVSLLNNWESPKYIIGIKSVEKTATPIAGPIGLKLPSSSHGAIK